VGKYCRDGQAQMTIWCMISEATSTHSEFLILLAFPLQQWLHECTSVLHYTYIAFLVKYDTIYDSIPELPPECVWQYTCMGLLPNSIICPCCL